MSCCMLVNLHEVERSVQLECNGVAHSPIPLPSVLHSKRHTEALCGGLILHVLHLSDNLPLTTDTILSWVSA